MRFSLWTLMEVAWFLQIVLASAFIPMHILCIIFGFLFLAFSGGYAELGTEMYEGTIMCKLNASAIGAVFLVIAARVLIAVAQFMYATA